MGQGGERMSEQRASSSRRSTASTHNKILGASFPVLSVGSFLSLYFLPPSFPISYYNVQRAFASLGGAAAALE